MLTPKLTRLLPLVLILALAGCAAPAAAPAAPASGAEAPAAVPVVPEAPPVDPAASALEATAVPVTGPSAGGPRVFKIVPEQSVAQYAVEEEFLGQAVPFVTAVGKTNAFAGEVALQFNGNSVAIAGNTFTVDLSTLTSDRPRRDRAIREDWLESSKFPIATFVATSATDLPADAALGQDVSFTVAGDLTMREVTHPVTWAMTAKLDGDTLTGTATSSILMRDFGFEPPDIAGMLKVTDGVSVTVTYTAKEVN